MFLEIYICSCKKFNLFEIVSQNSYGGSFLRIAVKLPL